MKTERQEAEKNMTNCNRKRRKDEKEEKRMLEPDKKWKNARRTDHKRETR